MLLVVRWIDFRVPEALWSGQAFVRWCLVGLDGPLLMLMEMAVVSIGTGIGGGGGMNLLLIDKVGGRRRGRAR